MLKVSHQSITFQLHQKSKNLTLTNELNDPIIYKIKTNNIQAIDAKPNCGLIQANTSLSLLIRSLKSGNFNAKLQIIYANTDREGTAADFNEKWSLVQRNAFNYILIDVKRNHDNSRNNDKDKFGMNESKIVKNSQEEQNPLLMKSMKQSGKQIEISELESRYKNVQDKLNTQKIKLAKTKQQLQIAQTRVKQLTQSHLQIKINRTMGYNCDQHHTTFTSLVLIFLLGLVLGFLLRTYE